MTSEPTTPTDRKPDAPDRAVRHSNAPVIIDLADDGHEVPIAIRHHDGGVVIIILRLKASRGTLTAILPPGGVVREVEDTGEVAVSWWVEYGRGA